MRATLKIYDMLETSSFSVLLRGYQFWPIKKRVGAWLIWAGCRLCEFTLTTEESE